MKKNILAENLCQNFCPFYKPAKNDELACMGFLVVERLIEKGKKITFNRSGKKLDPVTEETLRQNMCIACPFYENDCDYAQQKEGALPCGGLKLLGHLLETKIIVVSDIKDLT